MKYFLLISFKITQVVYALHIYNRKYNKSLIFKLIIGHKPFANQYYQNAYIHLAN